MDDPLNAFAKRAFDASVSFLLLVLLSPLLLGLAIAMWIVDSHGGVIGVTSVEGVGSRFTIRLPR